MRVHLRLILILLVGALLVGCQGSETPPATSTTAAPPTTAAPSSTLNYHVTIFPSATPTRRDQPTNMRLPTWTPRSTNTPILTDTPTLTATSPFQPLPGNLSGLTITPAFLPRSTQISWEMPTPIATPAAEQAYRLRDLSAADALEMLRQVNDYSYLADIPSAGDFHASFAEAQMAVNLAAREMLLRFPDFPEREQARWLVAFSDTILNAGASHRFLSYDELLGSAPLDDWLAAEIERRLNLGWLDPMDLSSGLEPLGFEASPAIFASHEYDHVYGEPLPLLPVNNLFGDGRLAYFWRIGNPAGYDPDGLYVAVAQQQDGLFRVRPLHSAWQFPYAGGTELNALDLTGDGQPEVIMYIYNGEGNYKSTRTVIYQWQDDRFVEILHGNLDSSNRQMFGREGWEFAPPANDGTVDIRVQVSYLQGLLHWNGGWMEIARRWVVLPTKPAQMSDDFYRVAIGYAMEYDQAAEVAGLLQKVSYSPQNPEPALFDLVRFQLAMAVAQQSQVEKARSILQSIVDAPASSSYPLIPKAAAGFLESYQSDNDVYRSYQTALIQMYDALISEIEARSRPTPTVDSSDITLIFDPVEGTSDSLLPAQRTPATGSSSITLDVWGYSTGSVLLCNLRPAFRLLVASLAPGPDTNVPLVLRRAGVLIPSSAHLDLDGDGRLDWLLVTDSRGQKPPMEVWALLGTEDGYLVTPVFEYEIPWLRGESGQVDLTARLQTLPLPGSPQPAQILQVGRSLWVWRVHHKDQTAEVEILLDLSDRFSQYFSFVDRFEIHASDAEVWVFNSMYTHMPAWSVYAWQERAGGFTHIDPLERLVFELDHPQDAIPAIRKELALLNKDPQYYGYPTLASRLTYLLGLSYELSGSPENTVRTYLEVWRQFPETAFALLARAKLEEKAGP
jgi:hypothetical protein